jgi:hypothetical protein
MKDNFIIHNPYKKMTTILWNRFSCFKATQASQYYTERARLTARRKYIKPSLTNGVVQQIICTIKIRRAPTRHDIIYQPIITDIRNLNIVGEDRRQGIYGEDNPTLVRDVLYVLVHIGKLCA